MNEENLRKYGDAPYEVAVIHGGPGAAGEMKPVAKELSSEAGVLEPFQTEYSIEEQVDELRYILKGQADVPVTLVGYSWGGWLSIVFSAIYTPLVKKIILVGSPPFREKYAYDITETRLKRLDEEGRKEAEDLMANLDHLGEENQTEALARLGDLLRKADAFDPLPEVAKLEDVEIRPDVYKKIWNEATEVRKSGELLELCRLVECPVVAIHGDYDSHPSEGVKEPLSENIENFRFILLKKCGHTPWIEKQARDKFYAVLKGVIS